MRAEQPGLQIAEHPMDVRRPLVSPFRYADDSHAVLVAGKSRVRVSTPAIRSDPRTGLDVPSNERADVLLPRILDHLQAYPASPLSGTPVIVLVRENFDRARYQNRVLVTHNTPTSLVFRGSTDRRFIRLDPP